MPLDHARIALSNLIASYVYPLSSVENIQTDDRTKVEITEYIFCYAEFLEHMTCFHGSLGEMSC